MAEMDRKSGWQGQRPTVLLTVPQGQALAGFGVGILCIPGVTALMPGNVQNATTFDFPVLYHVLEDIEFPQIACGSPDVLPMLIDGAQKLVASGARAIVGACGSFGHYQKAVADAVDVPVYMSIMTQVPFLQQGLGREQKLLAVFASGPAYTELLREQCNITDNDRLQVISLADCQRWSELSNADYAMDVAAFSDEIVEHVASQVDPTVGSVVLQCSDLPPFAAAFQQRLGLPVFDMTNLIRWLHSAVARREFSGFM